MSSVPKISDALPYAVAHSIISAQSVAARVKAAGKKPIVHFGQPYRGQKILLLALYEKGRLRPDIENLVATAKSLDMYVLAVNTLSLLDPDRLRDKIDCYIERPNFGRDFGSYKAGFLHAYRNEWMRQCERLLMLNDSLFYSKSNLEPFLRQMIDTRIEVLGATENHEIEHHVGSFCISIGQSILQQNQFRRYWENYSNTDIRPKVIKRGEMKLSKTLRGCVSSPDQFAARFNLSWLASRLTEDREFLSRISEFYRVCEINGWKRPSLKAAAGRLMNKYLHIDPGLANIEASIEANLEAKTIYFVDRVEGLIKAIETWVKESNVENLKERVFEEVKNDLMECFLSGSQIHQNNILLHHLGMPLVKLDALYRGMLSVADVESIAHQLSAQESNDFRRLMFSKPYGGNYLVGWKRAAFYRGLI
ncbi:rhamnan synthesis F family protein [Falsiroseomonas sp.]|uniref:rhamnan synthesis F family protein n=1 Tax=Falsiroseomonas sp. TaxID=2870721 RepID=UPI003F6FB3B9